jgi:hypothetical protein
MRQCIGSRLKVQGSMLKQVKKMKRINLLFFILGFAFLFNQVQQATAVKFNLYANYSWESLALNRDSLWNPGLVFEADTPQTSSRLALNLETRLKWGKIQWNLSPLLLLNNRNEAELRLKECYVTLGSGNFEITAGKGIVKLGTGYMFTPISVITPPREISDPEDTLRTHQGVQLVKLDYYRENFSLSAMVFKRDTWSNTALLAYCHWTGVDWYGIVYYGDDKQFNWGTAFSTTIGSNLEIHGEWMLLKQSPVDFHRVYFESNPRISYPSNPLYHPETGHYNQYIFGINSTFKHLNIITEYYHRDWGLKPAWFDKLKAYYCFNLETAPDPIQSIDVSSGFSVIQQSTRGLMRDYLFIRAARAVQKNTDFSGILFMNLHDTSSVVLFNLEHRLSEGIYLYIKPAVFFGKKGSEFNLSWYSHSLQLGIRSVF